MLISSQLFAQTLTKDAKISLITVSPGKELYSTFGHSAIRIRDVANGLDKNYNYGTFNFNAPNFYLKFLRGQLPYQISAHDFYLEMEYWVRFENRKVTEQVLNLNQEQKQRIYDFLENNLLPQNKEYAYKFFTDNCSTRLRDVLQKACGDSLTFSKTLNADSSFRNWIDRYSINNNQLWAEFGMDLAIGLPSDEKTGWSHGMFIPDNLMKAFDAATIKKDGRIQPLVLGSRDLNEIIPMEIKKETNPLTVFILLFVLVAIFTVYQILKKSTSLIFDKIFFSLLGLAGWFLFFLWFFTDHGVTQNNMNLIWAFPLLFPLIFFLNKKQITKPILLIYSILNILLLISWKLIPQEIPTPIIPIILIALLRIYFIFKTKYGFTKTL